MWKKALKYIAIAVAGCLIIGLVIVGGTKIIDNKMQDLHGELEFGEPIDGSDDPLVYHNSTYYSTGNFLSTEVEENAVKIGWQWRFCFPSQSFFTDGSENPLFILRGNDYDIYGIYVRNDFDIYKQPFLLSGTDIEFVPITTFVEQIETVDTKSVVDLPTFNCHLKSHPKIKTRLNMFRSDNVYYVRFDEQCWALNDDFVLTLKENKLI